MADAVALSAIRTELEYEANIDNQVVAGRRHPPDRINALINRGYRALRSTAAQNGAPFFRAETTAAAIPAQQSGEDYIPLVWPTEAAEVLGVDVLMDGEWYTLAKLEHTQRRGATLYPNYACDAVGEWADWVLPQQDTSGDPTDVTAGVIAAWPVNLSGSYKVFYLPHWVDITTDSHVFIMYPDWLDWLLAWCTMKIVKRDNDKRGTFKAASDDFEKANRRVIAHSKRFLRGPRRSMRRDGLSL